MLKTLSFNDEKPVDPEVFQGKFQIQNLKFQTGNVVKQVSVEYRLGNIASIIENVKVTRQGLEFGKGKSVLFSYRPDTLLAIEAVVQVNGKDLGYGYISVDQMKTLKLNESVPIKQSYSLFSRSPEVNEVGQIDLQLLIKRVGPYFLDPRNFQYSEETKQNIRVAKLEKIEEKDTFIFRSKEKDPKPGSIVLELQTPKGKQKAPLPGYHEDVAVQTEGKKKKGKGKNKTKKSAKSKK